MKSSQKVMLLIETSRAYGQGLLRGIAKYSRLHGPWTFYRESEFYRKAHRQKKAEFDNLPLDGLIAHVSSKAEAEYLFSKGIPAILQCVHEKISNRPTIATDNIAIGMMAAEHLLERGFRHFAYFGLEDAYWSQERCNSFVKTVRDRGYEADIFTFKKLQKSTTTAQEHQIVAGWLNDLPKPLAVMSCNDDRGQDIAAACRVAGLRIPEDVIVIGVDNDELICDLSEMPLSSIELATENAGYEAAKLLDRLMSGENVGSGDIVVRPSRVVSRRSTDYLAIEDLETAKAVRFIRKNASSIITVNDVVNATVLSRRILEIRFRKILHQSINDIIQAEHIKRAVQLLDETNLPISTIAKQSGFSNSTYMGVVFKKIMGVTPLQFRKKIHTR